MKRALLLALVLLAPLLVGCQSAQLDRKALCLMLAVDDKDGKLALTAVFPKLTGGQDVKTEYTTLAVTGDDMDTALEKLRIATPYQLCFEQLRLLALGESVAKEDISGVVNSLCAIPRMRMNAAALVAGGEAGEFLEAIKPDFGNRVSKFLSFKLDKLARQGLTPRATLGGVQRELLSGRQDSLLMYGRVNENVKRQIESEEGKQGGQGEQPAFSQAGELLEKGDDAAEFYGACAMKDGSLARVLTGEEYRALQSAMGKARLSGDNVVLAVDTDKSARIVLEELLSLGCDPLGLRNQAAMQGIIELDESLTSLSVVIGE